jgi:hypothetical protein
MGIRLDQLHSEVFTKIGNDITNQASEVKDYLDLRVAEIDVVFGLPETTHVERDVESNKRNLEKSGFIEINRNFTPFRTGEQADTGVWVSNLNTNESPFEPRTIDGQKRGISVGGHILNYTIGNIGQNIDQMMNLPIAPNLPVFFPEDNDMVMEFAPSKAIIHHKVVTDEAIEITITKRITDEFKIDIDKFAEGDTTTYYYMDEDSQVFYLNNNGRSYFQNDPDTLLTEPYNRFADSFGGTFSFEKIYDSNAVTKYVDLETSKLFEIKTPIGVNATQVDLSFDDKQIHLEEMTVTRYQEVDGVLQEVEVTQLMLVTYDIQTSMLNGMETEILVKTIVSEVGFETNDVDLNNDTYTFIEDNDIRMFVDSAELYYYFPFRKYKLDENGDRELDVDNNPVLVTDEDYKVYLPIGSSKPTTTNDNGDVIVEEVQDNITGGTASRLVHTINVETVSYYRIDTLMNGDTDNTPIILDENGELVDSNQTPNSNRPVTITEDNKLSTLTAGIVISLSEGKEFYYHNEVGTKYYRKDDSTIYYLDSIGNLYTPSQDVQELFEGTISNVDTLDSTDTMMYSANELMFFIDTEQLRTYIEDEIKQQIQLTDLNGYRVFEKADGTKVYAISSDKMVTIADNGVETVVEVSYDDLTPIFETIEVEEDVLNLVIPVSFNVVQGNVVLTRNGNNLNRYSDYNVESLLTLSKDLEFNEEINQGDTLYVKRVGKKDIILRLEKKGDVDNDVAGHWANNNGDIVMPEPLTGNNFNWTEGEELSVGEELDFNDIVKGLDGKYYQYTGSALAYEDMGENKSIVVDAAGIFWEDITVSDLEYERKGQNYKIFDAAEGDTIRFTVIRRVWEQNPITGEMEVAEKEPYVLEKTSQQDGENLFVLNDVNFLLDDNAIIESFILLVENIKYFSTYEYNRANDFTLMLTGLQTVAKNEDSAMIYGEDYFLANYVVYLTEASMSDEMVLSRIQAPQAELKIDFVTTIEQPKVTVPFEIIKNKFDIVVPQTINGHEYTWIMGDELPEGKVLQTGDVVFDKEDIKFYKYDGSTKGTTALEGGIEVFTPTVRESLLRQSDEVQKEILRQYQGIQINLNEGAYWDEFNVYWAKEAKVLSDNDGVSLTYFIIGDNNKQNLNVDDDKVVEYLNLAKAQLIEESTHILNDDKINAFQVNDIMTEDMKIEIKRVLNTNLDQAVLKKIRYNDASEPTLDEDGNIVYDFEYTRNFMVQTAINEVTGKEEFIDRTINGVENTILDMWTNITADEVGYYRFGKTFTILDTKTSDQVVVRLLETGAEAFTSKRVTSEGGEITFAIDFNIEEEDGTEIGFEVIYEEINWTDGSDYIQEGQDVTLTMVEEVGQNVIIRRNDEFDLIDIVVLERKDLVFVETWHEPVSETGYIFPYGNVQYQGTTVDGVTTQTFDHKFYDTIDGETSEIQNGAKRYCQMYQKGDVVYNYYAGTEFTPVDVAEKKYIDETFLDDSTVGTGWKVTELSDEDRKTIFQNADHNLYYDGESLIQVRYRTRVVALNLFNNYFKGTSDYMSEGLRFQGKSPITSRIVTREIGEYTTQDGDGSQAGKPITETLQVFAGDKLVISSSPNSLLYKEGKLFDDALFTVEEPTELSHNGYVNAVPVAIVNRRNQGVYHPEFNDNGTGFFINGIHVSEDKEDFADDISGFTLVDENSATLETSSVGRDRKAKFKVMLEWLFSTDYKAGGSMVSKTTYRPDALLYDEINTRDIIDLRIDANDQRKRIEDLEADVERGYRELADLTEETNTKFEQTTNYINATANLIYKHIAKTEEQVRKDMDAKDLELEAGLDTTNTNLADLSANVFSKDVSTNLLIDTIVGLTDYNTNSAFSAGVKPSRDEIEGMINAFVENMEGPYTKPEFMKFLVTVLKAVTDKTMLSEDELGRWIRRLSVKDLAFDASTDFYSRAETLELIYEGLILASSARVLPPQGSDELDNWEWAGTRYDGYLGTRNIELNKDFQETSLTPVAVKNIKTTAMTKSYTDIKGNTWNKGYIAGPTIWGNVHKYHAIYTTWIFVETPFKVENVKMNGDDSHAIYINEELVARNKYCCRDTAYSYEFTVAGWYRIDAMYSENNGGHYVQLGWNPTDYQDNIKYMTTTNMDGDVAVTKMRLDNWASKLKSLVSTIKGDASGYFTKLETKLILIEGLTRIRNHILTFGTIVTEEDLTDFHNGTDKIIGLEPWLDNIHSDGKFTSLGYDVQPGTTETGAEYSRADEFRPLPDMTGKYNKEEVLEVIRKGLQLVNGIDSINSKDIQKWVDRLNISIDMDSSRYFTKAMVETLVTDGTNYLAGLDSVTSYEISAWLDEHIIQIDSVFLDANGDDKSETVDTNAYTKEEIKSLVSTKLKAVLGAQAAQTQS